MLNDSYDNLEDIPAGYQSLYIETDDGTYTLRSATDIKTIDDVTALQTSLKKERQDHKAAKAKLSEFARIGDDPENILSALDELADLRATIKPDVSIEEKVKEKLNATTAPLQRTIEELQNKLVEKDQAIQTFTQQSKQVKVASAINTALQEARVRPDAIPALTEAAQLLFDVNDDGEVTIKDGVPAPVGMTVEQWLNQKKETSPFFWPDSQGAGAVGSKNTSPVSSNPFSKEGYNLTEQSRLMKTDPERARRLAKSAGVEL